MREYRSSTRSSAVLSEDDMSARPMFKQGKIGMGMDSTNVDFPGSMDSTDLNFIYNGDSLEDLELSTDKNTAVINESRVSELPSRRGRRRYQREETETSNSTVDQDSTVTAGTSVTAKKIEYSSDEEFMKVLEKRHEVDMNAESMDPIEWAVRSAVPIPEKYYWDTVHESDMDKVPTRIKIWHNTIAGLWSVYSLTENWIAKPLVDSTGLTNHRHDYVTDFMTKEEWEQSERTVQERIRKRKEWEKRQEMGEV